jgi:hypothetical protein
VWLPRCSASWPPGTRLQASRGGRQEGCADDRSRDASRQHWEQGRASAAQAALAALQAVQIAAQIRRLSP